MDQYLDFDQMIDLLDVVETDIQVPGWGKPLRVRPLSVEEVNEISRDSKGDENRAVQLMVQKCLVAPALTDAQVRLLWTKHAGKMQALIQQLSAMNGLGTSAQVAAQTEQLEATFRPEPAAAL